MDDILPTPEARELADYMSDLSERAFYAQWLIDLEYMLWKFVVDGPGQFGHEELDEDAVAKLRKLSLACGGWIVYADLAGLVWVPGDDWIAHLKDPDNNPLRIAEIVKAAEPTMG